MTTAILISIVLIILAARRFMKSKEGKKRGPSNMSYSKEDAEKFVQRLEHLGYFKYADSSDLDDLKKNMQEHYAPDNELTSIWDETGVPKDYRYYFCDGEDVYEEGGMLDLLEKLKPTFEKLNFKYDITDYFADWDFDNKWLNQGLTINGTKYIIFKNFPHMGWGESPKRIAEILNIELANQNKEERIYLVSGGNDGRLIFLTQELYQYIYSIYQNTELKPLELQEWAKVMGVKPMTF